MEYQKTYDLIIEKAKNSNREKSSEFYFESHHIIPKCLGGSDMKENRVLLTAKEHFICHKLLLFIYPNNLKISQAFHVMVCATNKNKNIKEKIKISSRDFERARLIASEKSKGSNNYFYGKKFDGNKNPFFGKKHKEETINKLSGDNHWTRRLGISEETRMKMRESSPHRKLTHEEKEKLSRQRKGIKHGPLSDETKRKISASSPCRKWTQEQKDKLSAKKKGIKRNPEHVKKRLETLARIKQERLTMIF